MEHRTAPARSLATSAGVGGPGRDEEIHRRLLSGDQDVLAELFRSWGRSLLRVAEAVTHDREAAEDVVQVVMVSLWQHPERFRPEAGGLRPWLALNARSRALDWLAGEGARRRRQQHAAARDTDPAASVEDRLEQRWVGEQALDAMQALPDSERIPIALAYFGHLSYEQVAAGLSLPAGTVKSRIRSGLRRMSRHPGLRDLRPADGPHTTGVTTTSPTRPSGARLPLG